MKLRRELGPASTLLVTVGAMIGSGVFATPRDVALVIRSPALTLVLWAIGGALALLGAFSFAELGAAIPETGGLYVYLRRAYGPFAAFSFAWAMLVVLVPSSMGFFAQVAARHIVALAGLSQAAQPVVAVAGIAALVMFNLRGVGAGAAIQNTATVLKYGGVLLVAALGLFASSAVVHGPVVPAAPPVGVIGFVAALVPVLWAYDGWIDVTSIAGEVRNPEREIPRSLALGTALVTGLYLLVNVSYLRALGPDALSLTDTPAADAALRIVGPGGRTAVLALVAVSTFGGCAVALLTGSRVVYAVAADGLFFKIFAHTSRAAVPDAAVAVSGTLAVGYVLSPLGRLGDVFVIGAWPFYAAGAMATLVLRRKDPGLARPYRTPGYPLTNIVFALASLAIVAGYAVTRRNDTLASLGVIALGGPVYLAVRRARREA